MISRLHQFIHRELNKNADYFHDEESGISVMFYPQLDRAYIEVENNFWWIEAHGVNHALEQYYWCMEKKMKLIGDD
jgi:hypothetical protein